MSEIGGGDDDGKEVGGSGQESGNETESASSAETSSSVEDSGTLEGTGPVEGIGARGEGSPTGPTETGGGRGIENVSVSPREITTQSHEVPHGKSQILETPASLEQTQKDVESYHQQSIEQILALNGKYMSEEDRARVAGGSDKPRAIESDPNRGRNGGYLLYKGRSSIEVSAMDQQQMERTTKHETNHFASKNREMLVPEPDKKGYADEVVYPFGYGLSYTNFTQTLKGVTFNADTDNYEVEVEVTNTGDVAGKSVVEVYAQTPYGDYEKQNSIEKSAVQVVGFEKTDTLEPGQSQTVTVECERYMLASYDSKGAQGYILSAGDYYLAVGDDSHDALNNILAAKGYTTANGMTADGDAAKVYSWNQAELDTTTYKMSRVDDIVEVTNQFDNADLNYYGVDFTYLSRNDWSGTYPVSVVSIDATDEMIDDLNLDWYKTPADAPAVSDFTQGADNGLKFIDMRLVDWDDDEQWDAFLDQLTVADMTALMPDTFGVAGLDKIGMPAQKRADDCLGVGSAMIATGDKCLSWVSEVMTARTWNRDRMERKGSLMAIQAAYAGINEVWYGGGNTHRTPFGGRNQQYYSEDANYGYMVGTVEAAAMQANGVNYCIKHFAMNDQESGRESLNTFATEQTVREAYLRAFEGAFVEGGAQSTMTAFNRIGVVYCAANLPLLNNVLRGEWGFKGHITTDGFSKSSLYKTHYMEMITAGVDFLCLDPGETAAAVTAVTAAIDAGDGYIMQQLREATKANVYAASRSISVNGLSSNSIIVNIVPWWEIVLLVVTAICGIAFIGCTVACVVMTYGKKNKKVEG